ncbi:phosphotransferase [Streptomyces sp. NPDC056930]|uniref:phosphotransferase n=1 Tax=Streptomyces sp. NPDC056930 TaxID=3345967 RepID=UPI00364375BB
MDTESGPAVARLLRYLPGGPLSGPRHLSPSTMAAMGTIVAKVSTALPDFRHPGLERVLQWDPRHADRVVAKLAEHIDEPDRRTAIHAAAADAWARVQNLAAVLPSQAVHLDLTDDNLIRSSEGRLPMPDGVIDFGDLTTSWAVVELALSLSSMLHHDGVEPHHVLTAVRAFHAVRPLSAEEAEALWPLVVLRAAVLVVSGRHQASVDEGNDYAKAALDREWRIFEQATRMPLPVMTHFVKNALHGRRACPSRCTRTLPAARPRRRRHHPPRPVHRHRLHRPRSLARSRRRGPTGGRRARGRSGCGGHPVRARTTHSGSGTVSRFSCHGAHRCRSVARPGRRSARP